MSLKYSLPRWHLDVLEWFEENERRTFARRPFDVGLSIKVSSLQKGIWKPAGTEYAVSVVQTHKGIYADVPPVDFTDGTWDYFYHQQGQSAEDIANPSRHYANIALLQNMKHRVPVGVITPADKGSGYKVLGLAYVVDHRPDGYFRMLGPVRLSTGFLGTTAERAAETVASYLELPIEKFDPHRVEDERQRVVRQVRVRQGGQKFRAALLHAYDSRCAVTQYDACEALEAAHISPYLGPTTNHVTNGLLLRADMHNLFDLGLIAVETADMSLVIADDLVGTKYEQYAGHELWLPRSDVIQPSISALNKHRSEVFVA